MADCATVLSPIAELSRVALFVSNYRQTFVSNYKQAVVSWKKNSFNESIDFCKRRMAIVLPCGCLLDLFTARFVPTGSPSRGGDVTVYVYDINQPSLHTPFSSVLLSISVFVAL